MNTRSLGLVALGATLLGVSPMEAGAQRASHPATAVADTLRSDTSHAHAHAGPASHAGPHGPGSTAEPDPGSGGAAAGHAMWMRPVGGGWTLGGMAQLYPIVTSGSPTDDELPIHDTEAYATQPAVMLSLEAPSQAVVLRTTLNFEAWTQADGEYTFGGWGEGFLDKRHPHTLLHEATVSLNAWEAPGGAASLTLGKGFAAYGTEDPMSRPLAKFPTNHHLSQILERWLVTGTYLARSGLSLEASVFGGQEPEDAYDLSNIESFGDSYSARVTQRFGGSGAAAPWEVSASWAHVEETHHESKDVTELFNAALRHAGRYGFGKVYALAEASKSEPESGEGYWALLGESRLELGRHRPYYRFEYATRPEYERQGLPGTDGFYRYDHDSHAIGASRWQIHSLGYETEARTAGLIARPFVEVQYNRVGHERGDFSPVAAFGDDRFWSVSTGFKLFLGGDGMRMGTYGVLDPMTSGMRSERHVH